MKSLKLKIVLFTPLLLFFTSGCGEKQETAYPPVPDYTYSESVSVTEEVQTSEAPRTASETAVSQAAESAAIPKNTEKPMLPNNFPEEIEKIYNEYWAASLSLAVFSDGKIIYTKSFGYADKEAGILASDGTKYRVASVSKTVTAMLAMTLWDDGKLDIDAPLDGLLNLDFQKAGGGAITARHLLTHTSGIIDDDGYDWALSQNPPATLERILAYGGVFSGCAPGFSYIYSNFGAGIMSAVIEAASGKRFYEYAEERLFGPLGMDAGYLRSRVSDTENIANIYSGGKISANVKTWGRIENYYDLLPLGGQYLLGQCELIISATDLARLGIILAGGGTLDGEQILSQAAVEEMLKPQISADFGEYGESYGIGIRSSDFIVTGRKIYGHPGTAFGMVAGLYFDPKDQTGVAIITNGCSLAMGENGVYSINNAVMNALYG